MAKDFSRAFYHSTAWRKCREGYIRSVHYLCEECGAPGEEVHHKIELSPENINDPNITLNWANLQLLCHKCHDKTKRNMRESTRADYQFGADGQLIPR